MTFLNDLKSLLRSYGYEEVEPNPNGGGIWKFPEGDVLDKIVPAVVDALHAEDEVGPR